MIEMFVGGVCGYFSGATEEHVKSVTDLVWCWRSVQSLDVYPTRQKFVVVIGDSGLDERERTSGAYKDTDEKESKPPSYVS